MGTAFTYQGRLIDANEAADGLYDFQFKLYDSASNGNQIGGDVNASEEQVNDGYFTVRLDLGNVFDGNDRWLQIGVRPCGLSQQGPLTPYTFLSPRQQVTPTPYAIYAKTAGGILGGIDGVPSGVIVMWAGSIGSIPSGWHLCDGTNGTPDLRDRFIVGAGNTYSPGNTGGSNTHTHSLSAHTHSLSGHTHTFSGTTSVFNSNGNAIASGGANYTGSHSHTYSGTTVGPTPNTSSAPSLDTTGSPTNGLPPYYALAYIMKL
jgi:hypothetical protein